MQPLTTWLLQPIRCANNYIHICPLNLCLLYCSIFYYFLTCGFFIFHSVDFIFKLFARKLGFSTDSVQELNPTRARMHLKGHGEKNQSVIDFEVISLYSNLELYEFQVIIHVIAFCKR